MTCDPRSLGAKCDECPLREISQPVPTEQNNGSQFVGDYPGENEEREGRPFVGPNGSMMQSTFGSLGLKRRDANWTNVVLCRPPESDMNRFLEKLRKRNREIVKENIVRTSQHVPPLPLVPTPMECCAPRLWNEVMEFDKVLAVGGLATKVVFNSTISVMAVRGSPTELDRFGKTLKVVPTLHPSFVSKNMRWMHVMKNDILRAVKWWNGVADWSPPVIYYHPRAEDLRAFLADPSVPYWTYDVETDGIESLTCGLRCVGIGTPEKVVIVGYDGIQSGRPFYQPHEQARVHEVLKEFFADPNRMKVGHNAGNYDRIVIEQHFGVTPAPLLDTIMLHRLVESELPHNLGFLGSMYTGAPSWKCYDGETEVLTPDGWVRFDALQRSVEVAQWDNGAVSFVQPVAYVDQPYTGKVWKLTNQAVDLVVTPDHKMIYRQKGTDRLKICAVQDLPASAGTLPHTGVKYDENAECDPAFVRLLAATQADGSWVERADGWAVDFGFTKERKIERLTDILTRLNVPYTVKETGTKNRRTRIWVEACAVTENLYALLGPNKIFPASLLDLPMTLRSAFLDELPLWDGTATDTHTNYNTVEKANADMVQAVAAITGRTTRLALYANGEHRPVYRVSLPSGAVRDRSWSKLEGLNREQVDFDDRIYCVSVPSGFILVRRNGKVTVSGNTDREGRKLAYGSETDHELHEYCGLDVAVTAAVVPPLYEQVRLRDQMRLVSGDHRIQAVCAEMHRIGMFVDQGDRGVREKTLVQEAFSHREALCKLVEMPKLNPGSPHQLRELLFEKWKIEPPVDDELRYTLSGDPSTSDNVLRSCLSIPGLTELQLNAIRHIRYYRKAQKLLGTYVAKLRFNTDLAEAGWDEEEEYEEREARKEYGEEKKGIVDPRTGRMYPGYNAHVAVTGRLSSSKPINAQNFPSKLRSMVTAAPGHILVGADADQLELRIAASLWKSELYLAALAAGADPHASTALAVFGDKFRACNGFPGGEWKGDLFIPNGTGKWASDAKRLRDLAKRVQYASQYAASVETVHRVIAQTETNNEKPTEAYPWPTVLPYLDISVREVRMMHEKWVENAKFDGGWDMEMETYRTYGFLAEPILGRRRDFLDGENLNEIVNFRIQSSGASLMNKALLQIHEQIPLHKWGPHTGIINQCHDSIVVECPLDGAVYVPEKKKWEAPKGSIAWNVKHIIEEAMNQTTPALPGVAITATAEIGMRWNEV